MEESAHDANDELALVEVKRGFYENDLPAAVSAAHAMLAAIDPASLSAAEQLRRARVLLWLVRCGRRADALDDALANVYTGIAAARAAGDRRLECQLLSQYVHVLASLGQNELALDEGYKALRLAVGSGDSLSQAACWLALGHVHWAMQQWRDSEHGYAQSLSLAQRCGDKEVCGLASNGIAAMEDHYASEARDAGRSDDALVHARRSFALLEDFTRNSSEIGDRYNAWIGAYNQACCLFGMREHERALSLLKTQLDLLGEDSGSRRQLIMKVLGDIHLAQGRHVQAIDCQTEAIEIAERLQLPMLAMDACRSLVDALERSGDFGAALAQHKRYHAFYVQLSSSRAQAHARAMSVMYETEKTLALAESERHRAERLALANSSLVHEKELLHRSLLEDALTGLANRRHFDLALEQALRGDDSPPKCALAMIDVDLFKRVNDRFSHLIGDAVLRRLGGLLQRHCRKQDLAARYGGEEFALIFNDVDQLTAYLACERLRAAVEAEPWSELHADLCVTVSIGCGHAEECQMLGEPSGLLALADTRLYAAKRRGRNLVVGHDAMA